MIFRKYKYPGYPPHAPLSPQEQSRVVRQEPGGSDAVPAALVAMLKADNSAIYGTHLPFSNRLGDFIEAERIKRRAEAAELRAGSRANAALVYRFYKITAPALRRATVREYDAWLLHYLAYNHAPDIWLDAPMPEFKVATKDFTLVETNPGAGIKILIPEDVKVEVEGSPRNVELYFMGTRHFWGTRQVRMWNNNLTDLSL